MPLLLADEESKGFDSQTASNLFWKPVPVLIRQNDREDQVENLTFRILTGATRHNHNLRVLRINISSEADLFFLHTLEVSEEDFQSLKNEQGILVDFASFPGKIITLLDKCISAQLGDSPRFQAVLHVRGAEAQFKIMEINDFKQLPHITLAFRPGNDATVKQFLAFRLFEVQRDATDLSEELRHTKDERDNIMGQFRSCKQQLAEVREAHEKHLLEADADMKAQRIAQQEERMREVAALKDQYERERADQDLKYRQQLEAATARCSEFDSENRKLREIKFDLDTKVSELSHRLGSAEGANRALEEETARLKTLNQQLGMDKHEREMMLNEARAKLSALDEKAQAQAQIIEQQKSRIHEMETAKKQLENRCDDLKDSATGHDQRAMQLQEEILKGNKIIEGLANDVAKGKEKLKRKQAIIVRQEEVLEQQEQQLHNVTKDLKNLQQVVDSLKSETNNLKSENGELKAKLEDSKHQLQENERMIRWLNQQITDSQKQATGAVPGSRYSFSMPPPSIPGSTTTATIPGGHPGISSNTTTPGLGRSSSHLPTTSKYLASSSLGGAGMSVHKSYSSMSPSRLAAGVAGLRMSADASMGDGATTPAVTSKFFGSSSLPSQRS